LLGLSGSLFGTVTGAGWGVITLDVY